MRIIEENMLKAIKNHKNFKNSNTEVYQNSNGSTSIYLHGNLIADFDDQNLYISTCGRYSNTTKSRLNAILSYFNLGYIRQKNRSRYLVDGSIESKFDKNSKTLKIN